MNTNTTTLESLLDSDRFTAVSALYSWSTNYEPQNAPFALFLDLIGWSEENLGEALAFRRDSIAFDFISMSMVGSALLEISTAPQDAFDFISAIISAEIAEAF